MQRQIQQNAPRDGEPRPAPQLRALAGNGSAGPAPPALPNLRIIRLIAEGAYGQVWLAEETVSGVLRAVKTISLAWHDAPGSAPRYRREAQERELNGLREYMQGVRGHSHLLQVLHVGRTGDCMFYVMELADPVAGTSLEDPATYEPCTLARLKPAGGTFRPTDALRLCRQVLTGLEHLHGCGLLHRDVKPQNVLIVNGEAKLADIGLVARPGRDLTQVGTIGYMPPEGVWDESADLYAVGMILYEMVTGLTRERFPELPTLHVDDPDTRWALAVVNRVCTKAASPRRKDRFASAGEFLRAVDDALAQVGSPPPRWRRLPAKAAIGAGLLAAAAVALFGVGSWRNAEGKGVVPPPAGALSGPADPREQPPDSPVLMSRKDFLAQLMRDYKLVAWWNFDDPAHLGRDVTGNGYDLTMPALAGSCDGVWGAGLQLPDSRGDAPAVSTAEMEYPAEAGLTVCFWSRSVRGSTCIIQDYWEDQHDGETFNIRNKGGQRANFALRHAFVEGSTIEAALEGAGDEWVHLVGVWRRFRGNPMELYANGELVAEGSLVAAMRAQIAPFLYVGGSAHGSVRGSYDEVMLFDEDLEPSDIRLIYEQTRRLQEADR